MKTPKIVALTLLLGVGVLAIARSATIDFTDVGTFSSDSVLSLAGPTSEEVYGADFIGNGATTTADGYKLTDYESANAHFSVAGSVHGVNPYGGFLTGPSGQDSTGDSGLDSALTNGVYGGEDLIVTLDDLKIGREYTVLTLVADTRSGVGGRKDYVSNGTAADESTDQTYAFTDGAPAIGAYYLGTFTADAKTQTLQVDGDGAQYQTILLSSTAIAPEPGTFALVGVGSGLLLLTVRYGRRGDFRQSL